MPPKVKLHKNLGKPQTLAVETPTSQELNLEQTRQFELELCWCIQQIQNALKSGKLNDKQVNESTKILNTLMSNSAPIIKKRNVMRMSFGDYRAKMAAEEKKYSSASSKIKLVPTIANTSSVFLKKSAFIESNGDSFRFNFPQQNSDIADDVSAMKLEENKLIDKGETETSTQNAFTFVKSDNRFQFNFASES